ncbi:MAG: M1 family metallopeptidase [Candidatus Marinimicrobia bacterium]|nr:M1 family metallopeptidase [Candidatus Neomarinimicrobiota bacterium]
MKIIINHTISLLKRGLPILAFVYIAFGQNYWQQRLHYNMDVKLVPEENAVYGESIITYVNNSPDEITRIYLNLYPNAFKEGSVKHQEFLREYGALGRAAKFANGLEKLFHEFDVNTFYVNMQDADTSYQYKIEDTVLETELPKPLLSGDSLDITIHWKHVNGEMFERAGRIEDQYNMAQWYPKPMVYDEEGWHINPFHAEGEFYGEFGTFSIKFDLPKSYIIAASGIVKDGNPGWNDVAYDTTIEYSVWLDSVYVKGESDTTEERRSVTFLAENVHDFAWVASKEFIYEYAHSDGIDIHVLYNKNNGSKWSKKVMKRSIRAMDWLSKFGKYPYPQVTITDRMRGGGMEYPMLIMNGSESEGLIVHELGHIWFYGILANNEIDAAWLDEGFTSFQTNWYQEYYYPPFGIDWDNSQKSDYQKNHWKHNPGVRKSQWRVIDLQTGGKDEPLQRRSYQYNSGSVYRSNVYTKGSILLSELKYIMGDSLFMVGMNNYYDQWKLKHVNDHRFIRAMEDTYGDDLDWFFDPWLYDTQILDYGVKSWKKTPIENGTWDVLVEVERKGDRFYPVTVALLSKDGESVKQVLQGNPWDFSHTVNFTIPFNPVSVIIDPNVYTTDIDFRNNYSGQMPADWSFRWGDMRYRPRNKYHVTWFPLLDYHPIDGWMPGISLDKEYYNWESAELDLNFATESNRLFWRFSTTRKFPYKMTGASINVSAYDYGGHRQVNAYLMISSKGEYLKPSHYSGIGLRVSQANDSLRAPAFDEGQTARIYGFYGINFGDINVLSRMEVAPDGLSDWGFSKLYFRLTQRSRMGAISVFSRLLAGKYWSNSYLPKQEQFSISGANPYDYFEKSYLRHPESFYGITELAEAYHLSGDGNIRGLTGLNLSPANAIISGNLEIGYSLPISFINISVTSFNDIGIVWDQSGNDYDGDIIGSGGFGLEIKKSIYHKPFYLRIDKPLWYLWDVTVSPINELQNIIISFEKAI